MKTLSFKPEFGDNVYISAVGSDSVKFHVSFGGYNSAVFYANLKEAKSIRDWLTEWIELKQEDQPFRLKGDEWSWDDADEKPVLIGISDGEVGSDLLGTCEHCHDLPRGFKYFAYEGTYWCEYCIDSV